MRSAVVAGTAGTAGDFAAGMVHQLRARCELDAHAAGPAGAAGGAVEGNSGVASIAAGSAGAAQDSAAIAERPATQQDSDATGAAAATVAAVDARDAGAAVAAGAAFNFEARASGVIGRRKIMATAGLRTADVEGMPFWPEVP